jgi:hypothetical protein
MVQFSKINKASRRLKKSENRFSPLAEDDLDAGGKVNRRRKREKKSTREEDGFSEEEVEASNSQDSARSSTEVDG